MPKSVIITCAPTGGIHTPTMSEHLPITPNEMKYGMARCGEPQSPASSAHSPLAALKLASAMSPLHASPVSTCTSTSPGSATAPPASASPREAQGRHFARRG